MAASNHSLDRRVLHGVGINTPLGALLEQLCTDSVYTWKDDFDDGLNARHWGTVASNPEQQDIRPFEDAGGVSGELVGTTGTTDNAYIGLYGKRAVWSPHLQCVVQANVTFSAVDSIKFEFGFGQFVIPFDDPNATGLVNVKATPTINTYAGAFSVLCYDTDDDTTIDIVARSAGTTVGVASSGGPTISTVDLTLAVAMHKGGGTRAWVNGMPIGTVEAAAAAVNRNGTMTTGDNVDHAAGTSQSLWLFVQNRADNPGAHVVSLDYVQAWQGRRAE